MPHQHLKGSFCRVHLWGGHSSICFSASSFSSSWLLGYLPSEIQARGGHHSFSDTSLFLFLPMTLQKLYQLQKTRKQGYCYWVEGVALFVNSYDVGDLESQAIENHASQESEPWGYYCLIIWVCVCGMYEHLCMWVYMSICRCRGQKRTSSVLLFYGLGLQVCGHTSFLTWVLGFKVMSHPHTPKLSLQPLFLDLVIYSYSFFFLISFTFFFFVCVECSWGYHTANAHL